MAARSVASGVALSFGLISASVQMFAALEGKAKGTSNVLVCAAGHEAQQIRQPRVCPSCGEIPFQQLKRARPVEGGLVVLEEEDLAEVGKVAERFKKTAAVSAHPVEQVEVLTAVGEKMYHLVPEKGHEVAYSTLLALVAAHPDLAFMARWTPRSTVGQFRLRAYGNILLLQERIAGGQVRPAPELNLERNDELVKLAEAVLAMPSSITAYDPQTYADDSNERLAELIKGRPVIPTGETTAPSAVGVIDLMEKLRAQVAATSKPTRKKKEAISA